MYYPSMLYRNPSSNNHLSSRARIIEVLGEGTVSAQPNVAIQKVGLVVDTAVQSGANTVSSIQFSLENQASFYNQALVLAVQTAQEKARTIASATGISLDQVPISITEITVPRQPPIPFEMAAVVQSVSTPIEAGQLEIKAQIKAKFIY